MIEDRNDWCISRQRTWGVPLPIFYCKNCEKEYVTPESLDKIQNIVREKGTNAWFEMSEKELEEYLWSKIKDINKTLPMYKYIKHITITDEPLIKTTTNKIKRKEELDKILEKEVTCG